jgi:long-chain acyl-CoA synthetase
MQVFPFENIPQLNLRSFLALAQSITQDYMGKKNPLGLASVLPEVFAEKTWQDCACSAADVASITQTFMTMFGIHAPVQPPVQEAIGNSIAEYFRLWNASEQTVTFFTSGSTGKPKPCTHSEAHLRQELIGIIPLMQHCHSALVTVPLHHLYGFTFGLLLPQALHIPLRCEAPLPTAIAQQMRSGDMVVGIPLLWAHIARMQSLVGTNITLLSGTAPLHTDIFEALEEKQFTVREFFGSSEMGAFCCRLSSGQPFELLPHFIRTHATEESIIQRTLPDGSSANFCLQDSVHWFDERRLVPQGRKDAAVQVAGVNIFPAHVASVICQHPLVKECTVRLMRPEEGNRLKVFIVPHGNAHFENLRKELRSFVKRNLKEEERPTKFDFGEALPRNYVGKPSDW